jgi:trimeric autotransporter adhesin
MTSNNQVSPVIRISRGERDASARATHLKAASKKYLETTIERKQMSTTTNFKRIALVAVAALGLGVLSSVPSQATINTDSVTLSSATATATTAETYTATSATVLVKFFGNVANDSMTITAALTAAPDLNGALPVLRLIETSSAVVETSAASAVPAGESVLSNTAVRITNNSTTVETTAKFAIYLATAASRTTTTGIKAGSYSVKITPAAVGNGALVGATAQTLVITVTTAASQSKTPDVATSKVFLQGTGAAVAGTPTSDSSVVVTRTAGISAGWVYFNSKNAAGGSVSESITAEISGQGTLGYANSSTPVGRSILIKNGDTVTIWADGSAGTGTVSIKGSTSGVALGSKTVTFYGPMTSLVGTAKTAILGVGANNYAVGVAARDSSSNALKQLQTADGSIYAFSSDATIVTVPTTAISDYASTESGTVTVTGVKAGTATITFGNASTLAASTIKSAPVTVRVGSTSIASVKVAFNKATYAPGEAATITLSLLDSTGLPVVPGNYELWSTTGESGLVGTPGFFVGGPAELETAVTTSGSTGLKTYAVQMPVYAGAVTVKGVLAKAGDATNPPVGALLTAAGIQGTTISATATVSDSGSAALAAVTALATTVAALRTLIVRLTNLVLKIQKAVK